MMRIDTSKKKGRKTVLNTLFSTLIFVAAQPLLVTAATAQTEASNDASLNEKEQEILSLDKLIQLNNKKGHFNFSLPMAKKAITLKTNYYGAGSMAEASGFYNLAFIYNYLGNHKEALTYYLKAVPAFEKEYGINHEQTKVLYESLIGMTAENNQYKESLIWAKKALAVVEKLKGKDNTNYVTVMRDIGYIHAQLGNVKQSEESYNTAIKLAKALPNAQEVYSLYDDLVDVYVNQHRYADAVKSIKDATDYLARKTGQQPLIALGYNRIGMIFYKQKDYNNAITWFEKSLAVKRPLYPEKHEEIASSYNNIASSHLGIENYTKAQALLQKSLDIYMSLYDEKHHMVLSTRDNLAQVYSDMGDIDKALPLMKLSVKALETAGNNPTYLARSKKNLGYAYMDVGDFARAETQLQGALKLAQDIYPKDSVKLADMYGVLGILAYKKENHKQSLSWYQKAIDITEAKLGKQSMHLAETYNNIAVAHMLLAHYDDANAYAERAYRISKKAWGENSLVAQTAKATMGNILKAQNNQSDALPLYQNAYRSNLEKLGKSHEHSLTSTHNLAVLYGELRRPLPAFHYAVMANDVLSGKREKVFTQLDALGKKAFIKQYENYVDTVLHMSYFLKSEQQTSLLQPLPAEKKFTPSLKAITNKDALNTAMTHWINNKGVLYDSENMLSMLMNNQDSLDKKSIKIITETQAKKAELNALYKQLEVNPENRVYLSKQINTLQEQISAVENQLASKVARVKDELGLKHISIDDMAKSLTPQQLYIDYAKSNIGYYFFTLDRAKNISLIYISKENSKKIDDLVAQYHHAINSYQDAQQQTGVDRDTKVSFNRKNRAILSELYRILMADDDKSGNAFETAFATKPELVISTDGALRLLPFEALQNPKGKYLIEEKTIRYIPSAKEWMRLYTKQKSQYQTHQNTQQHKVTLASADKLDLSIFYNPSYRATLQDTKGLPASRGQDDYGLAGRYNLSEQLKLIDLSFGDLPGTKTEGESILKLSKTYQRNNTQSYTQVQANKDNLLQVKPSQFLHIASHGFFINDKTIDNPMLKSGLALAGAQSGTFMGKVTALELTGMRLSGTDTVVLSACETGKVDVQDTEVVSGLTKAFIQAGANNVVMSLWSVSDKNTAKLMQNLYENAYKNMQTDSDHADIAQSLRAAKLSMIKQNYKPIDWAPFVLSGQD